MEPTSNPQSQESVSDTETETVDRNGDPAVICTVCRQSIPEAADRRWREELVHPACLAELRCGISLGEPGHRRRSREHTDQ